MEQISRFRSQRPALTFTDSVVTSSPFDMAMYSGGLLYVDSTSTGAGVVLSFNAKPDFDAAGSFVVHDKAGAAVTITVQGGRCYPLPEELFAAGTVVITTAAGATVSGSIDLKG